ncbi:MAG: NADH-quinone oxidoreductase subunit M, partial [Actinobacteria bacterium]|nr:NADH-quinone oxidoreductase subunit M [Actinomycetota bacterium]
MNLLTTIGLLPLVGVLVIALLPKGNNELIKRAALAITSIVAIASLFLATGFDKTQTSFQFVQSNKWISAFNINFAVGIDGISLVLVLLSTILVPIVVLATWHESDSGRWSSKVFYILILILETMMIGV